MPDNDQPMTLAEALAAAHGCGYQQREFDPNLIESLDKLGETFGPLGVAMAAAVRTEPEQFADTLREAYNHQRELWDWLRCDRYEAEQGVPGAGGLSTWFVIDASRDECIVATLNLDDAEDAARALAEHLNRKVMLAKVAQAVVDNSAPQGEK